MIRLVDEDFEALCSYLRNYSIEKSIESEKGRLAVRASHKTYISFLHLWAQCAMLAEKGQLHVALVPTPKASLEFAQSGKGHKHLMWSALFR